MTALGRIFHKLPIDLFETPDDNRKMTYSYWLSWRHAQSNFLQQNNLDCTVQAD